MRAKLTTVRTGALGQQKAGLVGRGSVESCQEGMAITTTWTSGEGGVANQNPKWVSPQSDALCEHSNLWLQDRIEFPR